MHLAHHHVEISRWHTGPIARPMTDPVQECICDEQNQVISANASVTTLAFTAGREHFLPCQSTWQEGNGRTLATTQWMRSTRKPVLALTYDTERIWQ
ncbi:MAG: hypothetical protein QG597_614 [Actinomycetota bacterium]|nr:hypothetical protein [Actinomycetota bacterium]